MAPADPPRSDRPAGMQTAAELMARVRQVRLRTRRLVSSTLAGGYKSSFKGSGLEFEEVRAYQHGDDVRAIDWKVTARKREPHVKTYREDRALTLHFLVDTGPTMDFGTRRVTKRELAAELVALLSFVALASRDQVGLTLFGRETGLHLDPGRSGAHVNRLVREVLAAPPSPEGPSDLVGQVEERLRGAARHHLVFLVTGPASPAPLAGLVRPGFHVAQLADLPDALDLPEGRPAVVGLFPEAGDATATFTHRPAAPGASGAGIWERLEVTALPEAPPRRGLGPRSADQQAEELRLLASLAIAPEAAPTTAADPEPEVAREAREGAAASADPVDRLAAWLLSKRRR